MLGRETTGVYPILPLAPGTPVALGALSWGGQLGVGLATDPVMLDAQAVADVMGDRLRGLAVAGVSTASVVPREGQEQPSA
jgi:hypothetical protein